MYNLGCCVKLVNIRIYFRSFLFLHYELYSHSSKSINKLLIHLTFKVHCNNDVTVLTPGYSVYNLGCCLKLVNIRIYFRSFLFLHYELYSHSSKSINKLLILMKVFLEF